MQRPPGSSRASVARAGGVVRAPTSSRYPASPWREEREIRVDGVQRETIRDLFAKIGVTSAREQFDMVAELTGVQITSVAQLEVGGANLLIHMLRGRASRAHRVNTGNSWADRDEDTWIDRL